MELILNGWITNDCDDHPALSYGKELWDTESSIPNAIQKWANYKYIDYGLGEKITYLPNCNMRIYYTDDECTLEEAESALLSKLDGDLSVRIFHTGYSEWTIDGLNLDEFRIGGHDLRQEIMSHEGEYCWIIITD